MPDTQVYCVRATGTIYPIEIVSIKEGLAGATKKEMENKTGHGTTIGSIAAIPPAIMQKYGNIIPPEILKQYNLDILSGKRPTIAKISQGEIFGLRENPKVHADFVRLDIDPGKLSSVQKAILREWAQSGANNVVLIKDDIPKYANLLVDVSPKNIEKCEKPSAAHLLRHPVNTDCADLRFYERWQHHYPGYYKNVYSEYGFPNLQEGLSIVAESNENKGLALCGMFTIGRAKCFFSTPPYGIDGPRWQLNFWHWALGFPVPSGETTAEKSK